MVGARITAAELLEHHAGGGFAYTRGVSQRIGAVFTLRAMSAGWRPATVTLLALAASLVTSAAVIAVGRGWLAALIAGAGWQVAYGLDCSDGQLARATGRTSRAGAALDLYSDWASRAGLVVSLVASTGADVVWQPTLVALLMAGQLAGLFHQAVRTLDAVQDLSRPPPLTTFLGLFQDPGLLFLVYAVTLAGPSTATVMAVTYGAALGGLRFVVRFGRITARALQA